MNSVERKFESQRMSNASSAFREWPYAGKCAQEKCVNSISKMRRGHFSKAVQTYSPIVQATGNCMTLLRDQSQLIVHLRCLLVAKLAKMAPWSTSDGSHCLT